MARHERPPAIPTPRGLVGYLLWRIRTADPRITLVMVGIGPLCIPILIHSLRSGKFVLSLVYVVLLAVSMAWFVGPLILHNRRPAQGTHSRPEPPWERQTTP